MVQIALAALHLLALAIGLAGVFARGRALGQAARASPRLEPLRRAFDADALWGIAAALWIGTGLWRYLGGIEKGTAYYNGNHLFVAKMALLAIVLLLEVWPMVTLIRWRSALRRGGAPDAVAAPAAAGRMSAISYVQGLLVVVMLFLAVGMARGFGARPGG